LITVGTVVGATSQGRLYWQNYQWVITAYEWSFDDTQNLISFVKKHKSSPA